MQRFDMLADLVENAAGQIAVCQANQVVVAGARRVVHYQLTRGNHSGDVR